MSDKMVTVPTFHKSGEGKAMTTREKILNVFESNKGQWLSGEALAKGADVSRAAVWKAVKSLQSEGYAISAAPNRGYCLAADTDILSEQGIARALRCLNEEENISGIRLQFLPVTKSTNIDVKMAAQRGEPEGFTAIAAEQTGGSGRRGRSFFSPAGTGVYISILLRPENCTADVAIRITTIAAVAACQAIESVQKECGSAAGQEVPGTVKTEAQRTAEGTAQAPGTAQSEKPGIKWVNDVFMRGKKVCGILTEGSFNMETGLLDYAVMGIGFNVYEPEGGFPEDIARVAGAVFAEKKEDAKNRLAAAFLHCFMKEYRNLHSRGYAEEYRKRSIVNGREIRVLTGNEYGQGPDAGTKAKVLGIDDDCRLHVIYEDGRDEWLSSGEISIRI